MIFSECVSVYLLNEHTLERIRIGEELEWVVKRLPVKHCDFRHAHNDTD